jgi:SNF2 family DNA or RNA helicase
MKDRSALVRSFNGKTDENGGYENDDAQKAVVLLANMRLLSTGYNIQGANNVCIFDLPWTPDQWDQTVGRAYRSGQTREVHVKSFVALGNGIEGRIYYAFQTHQEVTELSFNITNGENEKRELAKERLKRLAYIEEKAREARQKELDEA